MQKSLEKGKKEVRKVTALYVIEINNNKTTTTNKQQQQQQNKAGTTFQTADSSSVLE